MRKNQKPRIIAKIQCSGRQLFYWLLLAGGLLPVCAVGEGFRNPPAGAFNLGRAGGRIAHVADSSAVLQNPANLVDVHGFDYQFAPTVVYLDVDYASPSGETATTMHPWKFLPNVFTSYELVPDKFTIGLGINVPYGLANEWEKSLDSPLRYSAPYYTELKTINLNPTVAWKVNDKISLGVGFDAMYSELIFRQFLTPLFPNFYAKAKGTGIGFGANAGITYNITERQRVAATVRAPMNVDYDGDFDLNSLPGGGHSTTDFKSQIRFPTIVAVGYGIRLTDTIRVEADVEWLQFSRFKSLPIHVGSNPFVPSMDQPQNWRDTFTFGIAGDWQFAPNWAVRGGYQFYMSPVPESTYSPSIPDANQNVITVGLAYQYKRHHFEVAYGYDFYDEREITSKVNSAYNGTYNMVVQMISGSYRFTF